MASQTHQADQMPRHGDAEMHWEQLASQAAPEREARLRTFYTVLATLPEEERLARLRSMIAVTYTLPDEAFRAITESRLRAWLQLDETTAAAVAQSYDAVMREVPAGPAMRRVAVVQTLMRDFADDEQRRLRRLNPDERARGLTLTNLEGFADAGSEPPEGSQR